MMQVNKLFNYFMCYFCQIGNVPDPKIRASLKKYANGSSVNLSAIPKDKPILVVADFQFMNRPRGCIL